MLYAVLRPEPSPSGLHTWRIVRHLADTKEDAIVLLEDGDELWFVEGSSWQQLSVDDESTQMASGQLYLF